MNRWYLRSYGDKDTHRGELRDGLIHAVCGVTFPPRALFAGEIALPGEPPDPDQICPACYRAVIASAGET